MIVDFTVENFRSIKQEQVFSLHAEQKLNLHPGNISYVSDDIGLLKTAAIYGANASGKTNLLLAIEALKTLIVESGDLKDGDVISAYEPYLLSKETIGQPSNFEIEFYVNKERYYYQVKYDAHNILFEKLDHFKTVKPSNIFTRNSSEDWRGVKFGDSYKGGKKQFAFFSNNTYLSKAGNSPEAPEFIRDIYQYFRRNIIVKLMHESIGVWGWDEDSKVKHVATQFLNKADFGISKFDIEIGDFPKGVELPADLPSDLREKFISELSKKEVFYHASDWGMAVPFDRALESSGTLRLFDLIPGITMVLSVGATLLVDEIESSLHPHVAELVIKLFNDPIVNVNNAQLIYTTHNLSLMSQKFLRKDQVFLSIKSVRKGTEYFCLEEFDGSLKDSSPFAKWYDEGRLGGTPEIHYRSISEAIRAVVDHA